MTPNDFTLISALAAFFVIILVILWVLLPFAIFRSRKESIQQTKILESIERHLKFQNDKIRKQEHETLASL